MLKDQVEIMRLHRQPPLGRLIVEINGRHFDSIDAVSSDAIRRLVMAAVGDLITFAGGYQALLDAGLAPPPARTVPAVQPAGQDQRQEAFLASLEGQRPPGGRSIIDQIDDVLQALLAAEPGLAGRSIHLRQGVEGKLVVVVDDRIYRQPSDIEDAAVQAVIKKALRQWDAS